MISGIQQVYKWVKPEAKADYVNIDEACWLCGGDGIETGLPLKKGIAFGTFSDTNQAKDPAGKYVCAACHWSLAGRPPDTLRARTHFFGEGVHLMPQRNEIAGLILEPPVIPYVLSIAVSGQKHIVFKSRMTVNKEVPMVQFENESLVLRYSIFKNCLYLYEELLRLGCNKTEVEKGRYKYSNLKIKKEEIMELEGRIKGYRKGQYMRLCAFVSRKPEGGKSVLSQVEGKLGESSEEVKDISGGE